jgi:non-ribosomal peptide synthetase component F
LQISSLGALEAHPPTTLRTVVFGSEVFPKEHYERWRAALPQATFYQLYGPTEATGMSCVWRADRALAAGERIPIGAPLDNTDVILLSDQGIRILPVPGQMSEQGEIYLRGSCVTLGYDHAPEETAKAFVQNPLHTAYPEIVYKTGDLACYNAHGELEFLGRRDAQIKRMGHRVELGDIEEAALRQDGVQQCCCVYLSDTQQIVLFYTGQISEQDLLRVMQSQLPRYMLPGRVIGLTSIPLTQNGKKDRRALIALVSGARTTNS